MPSPQTTSESLGAAAQRERCARAFEEEFDYLYWTFRRYGVLPGEAEDLAQEVFVILWRRRDDFQTDRPLRPWLAGIAFRLANKHIARRRRQIPAVALEIRDERPLPDEGLAAAHDRELSRRAIASLPDNHRVALVMRDVDGVPMRQLAQLWSVPLFTAYTRVRTARKAFARAVTRLQDAGSRAGAGRVSASALLRLERRANPSPPGARQRARQRLAVLLSFPGGRWPTAEAVADGKARPQQQQQIGGGTAGAGTRPLWPLFVLSLVVCLAGLTFVLARGGEVTAVRSSAFTQDRAPVLPARGGRNPAATRARPSMSPPRFVVARSSADRERATLARGLLGRWSFERGATVSDSSGHGFDCVQRRLNKGSQALVDSDPDREGGVTRFVGQAWLECPQPELPARTPMAMTVATWVNPADLRENHRAVVSRAMEGGQGELFFLGFGGGQLILRSSPWRAKIVYPFPGPPGQWVHLAFTHGRSGVTRLYVDGTPAGEAYARPGQAGPVRTPLVVGNGVKPALNSKTGRAHGQFTGGVDEVMVYDRDLSAGEIALLAAGARPPPPEGRDDQH